MLGAVRTDRQGTERTLVPDKPDKIRPDQNFLGGSCPFRDLQALNTANPVANRRSLSFDYFQLTTRNCRHGTTQQTQDCPRSREGFDR